MTQFSTSSICLQSGTYRCTEHQGYNKGIKEGDAFPICLYNKKKPHNANWQATSLLPSVKKDEKLSKKRSKIKILWERIPKSIRVVLDKVFWIALGLFIKEVYTSYNPSTEKKQIAIMQQQQIFEIEQDSVRLLRTIQNIENTFFWYDSSIIINEYDFSDAAGKAKYINDSFKSEFKNKFLAKNKDIEKLWFYQQVEVENLLNFESKQIDRNGNIVTPQSELFMSMTMNIMKHTYFNTMKDIYILMPRLKNMITQSTQIPLE